MQTSDWVWGGILAVAAVVETWALANGRPGDTFSERTRAWFRVNTRTGKTVFALAWVGFSAWYLVHILT